jgi:ProP effector
LAWIEEEKTMKPSIKDVYATVALLAATWPKAFSVEFAGRKPLKVGIGNEIAVATEGAITQAELDAALNLYCSHKSYLKKLREGAERVDVDGNPVGTVTAEQAATAHRRIQRMEERHSARVRAHGLAIEEAARKAKADAEEAKRAAEIAAGKRKPLLRLPRSAVASTAAAQAVR